MKALWFLVTAGLMAITAHIAYGRGQRELDEFKALCTTPGVSCRVQFRPAYVESHSIIEIPAYVVGEFRDDDGGLR